MTACGQVPMDVISLSSNSSLFSVPKLEADHTNWSIHHERLETAAEAKRWHGHLDGTTVGQPSAKDPIYKNAPTHLE